MSFMIVQKKLIMDFYIGLWYIKIKIISWLYIRIENCQLLELQLIYQIYCVIDMFFLFQLIFEFEIFLF